MTQDATGGDAPELKTVDLAWREAAEVFDVRSAEYDRWYEDSPVYGIELDALQAIRTHLQAPRLEIGVGPGRFAEVLNIRLGLDPALGPLRLAATRGVAVGAALGEALPIRSGCLGSIYLLFTLCFLADPRQTVRECGRALQLGGHLVLGMVPAAGAWGRMLTDKKKRHHPFYRHANFYRVADTVALLRQNGFHVTESSSTLYQGPGEVRKREIARPGADEGAGFVILVAKKDSDR